MSEDKPVRKPVDMTPAVNAQILKDMGVVAINRFFDLLEKMIDAGRTDLFQGYASSVLSADFAHSFGICSDQAYSAIFVMETLMAGITSIDSVFGAFLGGQVSPFAPSLKTLIELKEEHPDMTAADIVSLVEKSRQGGIRTTGGAITPNE